jgi:hypothetical protein
MDLLADDDIFVTGATHEEGVSRLEHLDGLRNGLVTAAGDGARSRMSIGRADPQKHRGEHGDNRTDVACRS